VKIQNKVLVDLKGEPISAGDVSLTVATVLINCALCAPADNKPRAAKDVAGRYDLAIQLNRLAENEFIDIPVEAAAGLKDDMLRLYATIVSGPMLLVLDGAPN